MGQKNMKDENQKQWEQDVKDYGFNDAIYLWELSHKLNNSAWHPVTLFSVNPGQSVVYDHYEFRRKDSAALPFDLERAKAGDDFEFFDGWEWVEITDKNEKDSLISVFASTPTREDLRMKYPPKVQHG